MPLTLYTKPEDDNLIEQVKIKALKEKISVSEVALKLFKKWVQGEIKLSDSRKVK